MMEKIHVEGDPKLKNNPGKQYSMFIGRWQPWHEGHRWLIDQRLNEGKNVLICIRDIEPNDKNPFTAQEVETDVIEHIPPQEVSDIAATKIREQLKQEGKL